MKNKKITVIGLFVGLLAAAVVLVWLIPRRPARPDWALLKLLPSESDLYAVADLESLPANSIVKKLLTDPPGVPRETEYEEFVRATGFRYERDLKQVALAKSGPNWVGTARVTLDRPKITGYLETQGAARAKEQGGRVFTFGQSRPFRFVLLDDNLVGFSVGGDIAPIQQVLQRHSGERFGSAASELEQAGDFPRIPAGSGIWVVGRLEKWLSADGRAPRIGSFELGRSLLEGSRTLYLSVENGPAHLYFQVENHCDSTASAERIASSIEGILSLLRALPSDKSEAPERNFSSLLAEISVEQVQDSVFLRWQWDEEALSFLERSSP